MPIYEVKYERIIKEAKLIRAPTGASALKRVKMDRKRFGEKATKFTVKKMSSKKP